MRVIMFIGLIISAIILGFAMIWIARQCWMDSKDLFREAFDDVKKLFTK